MKIHKVAVASIVIINGLFGTMDNKKIDFYGSTSENFILRWTFQEACDFVYDPTVHVLQWPTAEQGVTFNPKLVKPGNLIFVRNAPQFFQTIHPLIENPYMILTMGEFHESMKDKWLNDLKDDKIIAWFSIHACERTHPKFYPMPIGLFQPREHFTNRVTLSELFKRLREKPKTKLVYSNYSDRLGKKPDRADLDAVIQNKSWVTFGPAQPLPFVDYMKEMSECKFALSPKGRGIDCYRTWEALIVGTIPIVKSSQLNDLYKGLPVLIINDWRELSEEFLNEKYKEIASKKYDISPLFCEYWFHKFDEVRNAYFKNKKRI
jgi:hypothetical protein